MTASEIIAIIGAIVAGLTAIGVGLKWLIGFVVDRMLKGLDANTEAIGKAAEAHTAAATAMVAAFTKMQGEVREARIDIRTAIGIPPPMAEDESEDGQPPPLTPIRGVPASPAPAPGGRYHVRGARKEGG